MTFFTKYHFFKVNSTDGLAKKQQHVFILEKFLGRAVNDVNWLMIT